jgi:outer membrane protein TolC
MGGRKVQFLNFKKDEYKIGLENYNKTILTSIQETNDALYLLKSVDDKYMIVNDRLDLSKKEYELMEKRLEIGTADNLNLLYQKQAELMIEIQAVSLKINDIIASINLYQSLGGFDFYTTENI